MSIPDTFEPLVSDYNYEWHNAGAEELPEGESFERALFKLDNGYYVSVVRSNANGVLSLGYENGKWEAVISRDTNDPLWQMLGLTREPATELNHLLPDDVDGARLAGNLDNAGINALVAQVMEQPQAPEPGDQAGFDLMAYIAGEAQK